MNIQNSAEHLLFFLKKIEDHSPFALIRAADGEYLILQNERFTNIDTWTYTPNSMNEDLEHFIKQAINLNIYIGIPCKDCLDKKEIYYFYINHFRIPSTLLTYANVFCNYNFRLFSSFLIVKKIQFHYIGPGSKDCSLLNISSRFLMPEFLVHHWNSSVKEEVLTQVFNWVLSHSNSNCKLYFVSVGPITNMIIPFLYQLYPTCQFLDVGSTMDIYLKEKGSNRMYLNPGQSEYEKICDFSNGHCSNPDITCILTFYKRPQLLHEQLAAIKNQTVPPKKIIIWVNHADGIEFPTDMDSSITVIKSSHNFGVWARFSVALLANTKYVCIFDDDTIPGKKWFENCYHTMHRVNGLLGTIGVVFKNTEVYEHLIRYGWDNPNENIQQVDIVGHSWFFKREWLQYLWKIQPSYDAEDFLVVGEDIAFSVMLQQHGIYTYVPPHPRDDIEMFGSIPHKALDYGVDTIAVSCQSNSNMLFSKALRYFCSQHNFKILAQNETK